MGGSHKPGDAGEMPPPKPWQECTAVLTLWEEEAIY